MAGRRRAAVRRLPAVIMVYGEDMSDAQAVAALVQALRPDITVRFVPRRQPLRLRRGATPADLQAAAQAFATVIEAQRAITNVLHVFAHKDCDAVEPAHEELSTAIEGPMRAAGYEVTAVTPAWEIEAWWFQWPEAVRMVNARWRSPDDYVGREVGRIVDAKEVLKRAVVSHIPARMRPQVRRYRESDSPAIASNVASRGEASTPRARSASYERFRQAVAALTI